ncbi:hypothetical protein Lsan_2959 [Legionella santicrucis]|uniref:Uncharacterized protein n=1 Tax=Legionella santicrucis TaxID=45074 RepID=A0A0W0YJF1_9GAMM|nr:hypothetical protein [Legionella santicrucis]KTD56799.1 hypothetical protein Lsan_2959 [Legionella santicrucis]
MAQEKLEIEKYTKNPLMPEENPIGNREEYLEFLEKLILENMPPFTYGSCVSGKESDRRFYSTGISPLFFSTVTSNFSPSNNIERAEKPPSP